jgi:hypothetical protein
MNVEVAPKRYVTIKSDRRSPPSPNVDGCLDSQRGWNADRALYKFVVTKTSRSSRPSHAQNPVRDIQWPLHLQLWVPKSSIGNPACKNKVPNIQGSLEMATRARKGEEGQASKRQSNREQWFEGVTWCIAVTIHSGTGPITKRLYSDLFHHCSATSATSSIPLCPQPCFPHLRPSANMQMSYSIRIRTYIASGPTSRPVPDLALSSQCRRTLALYNSRSRPLPPCIGIM